MKKRLKSWISSVIGGLIMAFGVVMIALNIFEVREEPFTPLTIIFSLIMGYMFLMGKDEWITELFTDLKSKIK
jgi:formate/nitrite transporter FocA (FNT family)